MAGCLNVSSQAQPKLQEAPSFLEAGGAASKYGNMYGAPDGGSSPRNRRTVSSCTLVVMMVIAMVFGLGGFLMGAWSISQLKRDDKEFRSLNTESRFLNAQTSALTTAVVSTEPAAAAAYGYQLVVNVFRGTGNWVNHTNMLFYRSDFCGAAVNDIVYLIGGLSNDAQGNASVLPVVTSYNPIYDAFTNGSYPPIPQPMHRMGCATDSGNVYVMGGYSSADFGVAPLDTMNVYNTASKTWAAGPPPKVTRSDTCAVFINGKMYVAGGYDGQGTPLGTIEEFDPATQAWTILDTAMAVPRGDIGCVASGGEMYIMGGSSAVSPCDPNKFWTCYAFTKTVEIYNPVNKTIRFGVDMLNARGDFGIVESSSGRILVAGGEHSSSSAAGDAARLLAQPWVEEYHTTLQHWTPKAPMPKPQFRFQMVSASGAVWALGGQPSCPDPSNTDDDNCRKNGLVDTLAFNDVVYPDAFVMVRNN